MSTAAPRELVQALWLSLLNVLINYLETTPEPTAAYLAVIRSFLRDCGVKSDASAAKDLLDSARDLRDLGLPFH